MENDFLHQKSLFAYAEPWKNKILLQIADKKLFSGLKTAAAYLNFFEKINLYIKLNCIFTFVNYATIAYMMIFTQLIKPF